MGFSSIILDAPKTDTQDDSKTDDRKEKSNHSRSHSRGTSLKKEDKKDVLSLEKIKVLYC